MWAVLLFALLISLGVLIRLGLRAPIVYVGLMYIFLAFGPVLNHLLGNSIYVGIRTEFIPQAVWIFFLGLTGLLAGALVLGARVKPYPRSVNAAKETWRALPAILFGLSLVSILLLIRVIPVAFTTHKGAIIAHVSPGLHGLYILLQAFALSSYFSARENVAVFRLYVYNLALFLVYSVITGERDFLFVFASVLIFKVMLGEVKLGFRLALYLILGIVLGTFLFNLRGSGSVLDVQAILNQGSLLFINTNVLYLVSETVPYQFGGTYFYAIVSLMPFLDLGGRTTLLETFKNWYAPGGSSGYGFALDAEAYLNFGYAGVFVVFTIIGATVTFLSNRFNRSPFASYFAVYVVSQVMYSLRNDSWILIHTVFHAAVFFFVSQLLWPRRTTHTSLPVPTHQSSQESWNAR
jgi:hypothetical protein